MHQNHTTEFHIHGINNLQKKKCSDSDCFSSTHYQIDGEIFIYSD